MIVQVENLHSEKVRDFSGLPTEIVAQLRSAYPWLRSNDLEGALEEINEVQMYSAQVGDEAGGPEVVISDHDKKAMWERQDDDE